MICWAREGINSQTMTLKNDYICARCSDINQTCCRLKPGMEILCFPLSGSELETISRATGLSDFYVRENNTPDFIRNLGKLMPCSGSALRRCFPAQGIHSRLKTDVSGNCTFLGPQGCRLDADVRPLYCRIYPFWFSRGKLTILDDAGCLAQKEASSVKIMLNLFGADPEQLSRMFCSLLDNLGLENE